MAASGMQLVDIKALLERARASLPVGRLIATDTFNLFEAMSALEVGNAKMDPTSQPPGQTLEQLLESGAAPLYLSPVQLLSVMDQLLCLEATWHTGASAAQTVFASLYMLTPERTSAGNAVLGAYCGALLATCREVRDTVHAGCVCDEEDFNTNTQGLPIDDIASSSGSSKESDNAAFGALDKVLASLERPDANSNGLSSAVAAAAANRLRFRRLVHQALLRLAGKARCDLESAAKLLEKAEKALAGIRESAALSEGASAPGYVESINSCHLLPAPSRVLKLQELPAALDYFAKLLADLQRACRIIEVADYRGLKAALAAFSAGTPSAVARAYLHTQVMPRSWEGVASPPAWAPTVPMLRAAAHLPPAGDLGADVTVFFEQAHIAVTNWVQAMLLNPCRQRRRLRRGLDDWSNLYQHAVNADYDPAFIKKLQSMGWNWQYVDPRTQQEQPGPLATWIERETCGSILGHLQLGFRLDLYQPAEHGQLYWYLDYVFTCAINASRLLHAAKPSADAFAAAAAAAAGGLGLGGLRLAGGKKGGKAGGKAAQAAHAAALAQYAAEHAATSSNHLLMDCHRLLCQSLLRLCLWLRQTGLQPAPSLPFNGEEQRFEQRFAVLHALQRPEPLVYPQFVESTATPGPHEDLHRLLTQALAHVRQLAAYVKHPDMAARLHVTEELQQELAALDKVAGATLVASNVLAAGLKAGQQQEWKLTFECKLHPYFPVLVLKKQ